jgi:sterol desaturase/sphingolipid hydroxylase (fatty acid hydroxylase superfamily)
MGVRYDVSMHTGLFEMLADGYQWRSSLYAMLGIAAITFISKLLLSLVPTFKEAQQLNQSTYKAKMERPEYAANHKWNRKWSAVYLLTIFGLILPFGLTSKAQSVWSMLLDVVVILMFYDFLYYFVHRFLFHGALLVRVHAIHHRQHNPCRMDSSYIHPLEVAIGLGLYVGSILILSRFMGRFQVATIILTWFAFTEINLHNHDLWNEERFPFKYLNYVSKMHHNHHVRFTGGNFATISLLYDWIFGTLDDGEGYKANPKTTA